MGVMEQSPSLFEGSFPVGYWERVATLAISIGCRTIEPYRTRFSRQDFTRRQLLAILVLRALQDTTYRGVCDFLHAAPGVREALGIKSVPHFTTLQKFAEREQIGEIVQAMIADLIARTPRDEVRGVEVAIDSTGFASTCASRHYASKRFKKESKYVKASVAVVCGVILPCALIVDWGPTLDITQGYELADMAAKVAKPQRLYADKGYDSEALHVLLRDTHGVESVIPPFPRGSNGRILTPYRSKLDKEGLTGHYGRRWEVESFFSGCKRITGQSVRARGTVRPLAEVAIKILAYALHR